VFNHRYAVRQAVNNLPTFTRPYGTGMHFDNLRQAINGLPISQTPLRGGASLCVP